MTGPGTLLDQWNLMRVAVRDKRLSRGDFAVLIETANNYYRRYGNSRASFTFLAAATGLSRRTVINCLQRLRNCGYLELTRVGSGTRPSEYVPNWSAGYRFRPSSGDEVPLTAEMTLTSPRGSPEVNSAPPKPAYETGSNAGLRKQGPEARGASPPPGLCRPAAGRARDSFEELWDAYGVRFERAKAKAEYLKLNPNDCLRAELITAAGHWRLEYDRKGRPKEYRKRLHNWLAGECWLEEPPQPFEHPKASNTVRRRPREFDDDYRKWLERRLRPGERALARFIDWQELESCKEKTVYDFDFAVLKGRSIIGRFVLTMATPSEEFEQLRAACGDDLFVEDFPGSLVWVTRGRDGRPGFERYRQSLATEPNLRSSPPAIGSSSRMADAGGGGPIEF
jgi:hypothetical protein